MSVSDLVYASLEQAINHHISMAPSAVKQMAQLHGKIIALEMLGTGQTIYLVPGPDMVQLLSCYEGDPDCLLRGSPMTIAQLRCSVPEGKNPIPDDMQVSGDQGLAEQFCSILRQIEINWEQYLSQYTGSLIAGEVGKAMNFANYWRDHIVDTLNQEIQGQLQQEEAVLPARHETEGFCSSVEQLENRLEQLQKRVDILTMKIRKPKGVNK